MFQSTLPSLGVGRLKLRGDDARLYGTEKEATLRVAEAQFYKQMAAEFERYQIGVNVYAFTDKYADIASLGNCSIHPSIIPDQMDGVRAFLSTPSPQFV